ncbi:uncharacterized protein BP5553_07505 [Venustampulla echinocandica]|uniref:ribonuclease T2 n=1 Tax=Venustampulla echinocandica TaxID=2656787 RepID=A0A370TGP6_9HELO|nr:uncharacterized protein BP5553_07505 [Venustampulla echinocandica]RDL34377.1 hypothetical protein BP5553_07505 [Venustampulla echinocandica]
MPSLRSFTTFASGLLSQIPLGNINSPTESPNALSYGHHCPADSPLSCHNTTTAPDSCCFIYPGGQLLQTQFWDASPAVGPDDSWTLHGLWYAYLAFFPTSEPPIVTLQPVQVTLLTTSPQSRPDLCDGSYPTFCNAAPRHFDITQTLSARKELYLLAYMEKYWLPNSGSPERFWQHEWNKHATCINTLSPSCYGDEWKKGDEVVDFFTRAVEVFKSLDTYQALATANILPSTTATYTSDDIRGALQAITGKEVAIKCRGNQLNELELVTNPVSADFG